VGRQGRAGLTLVEVMISIMVFSICIGGICWLVAMAKSVSDQARDHYVAANIAKNRVERGRTIEFNALEQFEADDVLVDAMGSPDLDGMYRMTTVVSNINDTLKEIVVTVEIRNRNSWAFDGQIETVQTLLADFAEIE
jgi:prepilin-type N-terminal cleavage/methylation domain-containing protein